MNQQDKPGKGSGTSPPPKASDPNVQGEGDYAADRRYRERTDQFLKDADVEKVARAAAPKSGEDWEPDYTSGSCSRSDVYRRSGASHASSLRS